MRKLARRKGRKVLGPTTKVRGGPYDGEGLLIGVDKTSVPFSCMSKGAYFNGQYRKGFWHSL